MECNCGVCNGTGLVSIGAGVRGLKRCEACHGTGVVKAHRYGHWEVCYVCSLCGEIARETAEECPFCHASMKGEQE